MEVKRAGEIEDAEREQTWTKMQNKLQEKWGVEALEKREVSPFSMA